VTSFRDWLSGSDGENAVTTQISDPGEDSIFEELDAIYWTRRERRDSSYWPSDRELERLVSERRERGAGPLDA
jgi:hypothetical protein